MAFLGRSFRGWKRIASKVNDNRTFYGKNADTSCMVFFFSSRRRHTRYYSFCCFDHFSFVQASGVIWLENHREGINNGIKT